jgi:hypothetical protein
LYDTVTGNNPFYGLSSVNGTPYGTLGLASGLGNFSSSAVPNDVILRAMSGGKLILQTGIGAGGIILNNNNVGIGFAAPEYPLDFGATLGDKICLWDDGNGLSYGLGIQGGTLQIHCVDAGSCIAFGYGSSTAFTEGMRVTGGRVGIGMVFPAESLDVAGAVRGYGFDCRSGYAGAWSGNRFNFYWNGTSMEVYADNSYVGIILGVSDPRLKEGVTSIADKALDRVMALKPATFKFKNVPGTIFTGSPDIQEGFISDELQGVIPSAVTGKKDALASDGTIQPQVINIIPVVAVLTKAVQEQEKTIQSQQQQIDELKTMIKALSEKK